MPQALGRLNKISFNRSPNGFYRHLKKVGGLLNCDESALFRFPERDEPFRFLALALDSLFSQAANIIPQPRYLFRLFPQQAQDDWIAC